MSDTSYPCFLRYQEEGRFYWLYFASNGEEVARSESYASAQDCDHSVVIMKACAPARYYADA